MNQQYNCKDRPMKKELSYFERFVALNFSELRRFIIEGPTSVFGKSINRICEQLKKLNEKRFLSELNEALQTKTEKQANPNEIKYKSYVDFLGGDKWNNYSYKNEDWTFNNPSFDSTRTDLEIYKSVCKFFEQFKGKQLGKSYSLDNYMEIILGYRYADEFVTRGATTSMQDSAFNILFKYAEVDISTQKSQEENFGSKKWPLLYLLSSN